MTADIKSKNGLPSSDYQDSDAKGKDQKSSGPKE